jgi:Winged helix domain, variant/ATPase family associated with various cellular activities (AAA)
VSDSGGTRLVRWLERVDALIIGALADVPEVHGQAAARDPFRGLHVSREDVEQLLHREPGVPLFGAPDLARADLLTANLPLPGQLQRIVDDTALSAFDVAVVFLALAPELDLRYQRLYAYLQDDVTCRRPTMDLALNLLTVSAEEKHQRRAHFAAGAPLVRERIIRLAADPADADPPLLAHRIHADEQIVAAAAGDASLDRRLLAFARLIPAAQPVDGDATARQALGRNTTLFLKGPSASDRLQFAIEVARSFNAPLLMVDVAAAEKLGPRFAERVQVAVREAWLKDAALFIEGYDALRANASAGGWAVVAAELRQARGIVFISGATRWVRDEMSPAGVVTIDVPLPDAPTRRELWEAAARAGGAPPLDVETLDALSGRFALTGPQVRDAVLTARNTAGSRGAHAPGAADYFAAARDQTGHDLQALAVKLTPRARWNDLVLPEDTLAQLREVCDRVVHRTTVLDEWGFGRKLSYGKGVTALFAGGSGTGKTLAAEVVAAELGLDLYRIDLATVISKYIGDTEKNLDRIFTAAETANAILFFDEAEALFGKRSEIKDAHDRYANVETAYLLQKMELYDGTAILATNLRQNLDDAMLRRLAFTVTFPFPEETQRRRIWEHVWPAELTLAGDVDLGLLAAQFKFSGGSIKNVALAAAFLAAADGRVVTSAHIRHAAERELEKIGKPRSVVAFPAGEAAR